MINSAFEKTSSGMLQRVPEAQWSRQWSRTFEDSNEKLIDGCIRSVARTKCGSEQDLLAAMHAGEVIEKKSQNGIMLYYFPAERLSSKKLKASKERVTVKDSIASLHNPT
jgi:hypothetical protein